MAELIFNATKVERRLATRTMDAIHYALYADRGSKYRSILRETVANAEDAYKVENSEFRSHLGASQIGKDCSRELWYNFRWASARDDREEFHKGFAHDTLAPDGGCDRCARVKTRMMRLLNRGHLEEARFIALLKMIGCTIYTQDSSGVQFKVSFHGGHFGGSVDSVAIGIPDVPIGEPCEVEMKTHNDTSFSKLLTAGLREGKPEHFDQMTIYMGGYSLRYGLYLAVNKDNDDLYGEIIEFVPERFAQLVDRAELIIAATLPPKRISKNPSWYVCKFCSSNGICHGAIGAAPLRNCRTCKHSRIVDQGWACAYSLIGADPRRPLSKEEQLKGCENYSVLKEM